MVWPGRGLVLNSRGNKAAVNLCPRCWELLLPVSSNHLDPLSLKQCYWVSLSEALAVLPKMIQWMFGKLKKLQQIVNFWQLLWIIWQLLHICPNENHTHLSATQWKALKYFWEKLISWAGHISQSRNHLDCLMSDCKMMEQTKCWLAEAAELHGLTLLCTDWNQRKATTWNGCSCCQLNLETALDKMMLLDPNWPKSPNQGPLLCQLTRLCNLYCPEFIKQTLKSRPGLASKDWKMQSLAVWPLSPSKSLTASTSSSESNCKKVEIQLSDETLTKNLIKVLFCWRFS